MPATANNPIGVDRAAHIIRGLIVAQEGPFRDGRGQFTAESLAQIAAQINALSSGLRSRLGHPIPPIDGIGTYLGRLLNARVDGAYVRADLHLAEAAALSPHGDLRDYVETLAEHDPDGAAASLVIDPKRVPTMHGPDIWLPLRLYAADIVDTPNAAPAMLSDSRVPARPPSAATSLPRSKGFRTMAQRHNYPRPQRLSEGEGIVTTDPSAEYALPVSLPSLTDLENNLTVAADARVAGLSADEARAALSAWLETYLAVKFAAAPAAPPVEPAADPAPTEPAPALSVLRDKLAQFA